MNVITGIGERAGEADVRDGDGAECEPASVVDIVNARPCNYREADAAATCVCQ